MRVRRRWLAVLSALIGVVLFVQIIGQTGTAEIWLRLRSLGFGFLLILAVSATRYLARSCAWRYCLAPEERGPGIGALWRARLAGEAIGDLTFGPVVAEPVRLVALGDRLSLGSGISSLAVENIAYAVSSCLMILAGAMVWLARFGANGSLGGAVLISLAMVSIIIAASAAVIGRRWKLISGAADGLIGVLAGRGRRRDSLAGRLRSLSEAEDYVFDFFARRPADLLMVAVCEAAFHLAGVIEIYAALQLIGVELTIAGAFVLESVNRAINVVFVFVPVLVGVDETGTGLVTGALGLGAAPGVTLAIIRKLRMFFWIGIGLVLLAGSRKADEISDR
jgi:hypothetical protein